MNNDYIFLMMCIPDIEKISTQLDDQNSKEEKAYEVECTLSEWNVQACSWTVHA